MTAGPALVVSGIGIVAPTGIGVDAHWRAVLDGTSGIGPITRFDATGYPTRMAGQVHAFDPRAAVPGRVLPQTDVWTQMAMAAAAMAFTDAGVVPEELPEFDMAVVTASSSGGTEFGQHEMERLYTRGPSWVSAYQSIAWFYAATTGQISIRHGLRGPSGVLCAEQAGGIDALGQARRLVRGGTRLVLVGGTDASLCPYGLAAQMATGQLVVGDDPQGYRPFAEDSRGHLPGEGGAMLVVEEERSAARGRRAYARVLGYAAGFDPPPGSGRPPVLRRTIEKLLADADATPEDVDVVFADAAAVPQADADEADAITAVFGRCGVPVTAPKTLTGRLYGGGAALDIATAALALHHRVVPATAGTVPADRYGLDLVVGRPRPTAPRTAMVLARGHGGFTAAVLLGRHPAAVRPEEFR